MIFWLSSDSPEAQSAIDEESRLHHDIIQGNFPDTYRNLVIKEAVSLQWSMMYCPQAEFVMKTDDDLFVQPWLLASLLPSHRPSSLDSSSKIQFQKENFVICYLQKAGANVHRDPTDKWFVSNTAFSPDQYPQYCRGGARVYTRTAVIRLLAASAKDWNQFIPIEDVYWGGIVAAAAGVAHHHVPGFHDSDRYYVNREGWWPPSNWIMEKISRIIVAHTRSVETQKQMWRDAVSVLVERYPCYKDHVQWAI